MNTSPAPLAPATGAFDDVQRFWAAVDASERRALPLEDTLEQMYFGRLSPALAQFAAWTDLTPSRLAETYGTHEAYYRALRPQPGRLREYLRMDSLYTGLRALFPEAVPARVNFVMGDFSCAGTVAPSQILLALEFFPPVEAWPLALPHLPLPGPHALPARLAHELVHVQQLARCPDLASAEPTVLELALLEGAAEYVGELLSGAPTAPHAHLFGQMNAAEVWAAFHEEADSRDGSAWIHGSSTRPEWPADLGHFVGSELCRAYHERHAAEANVVRDILHAFETPERFLLPVRERPGRSRSG